jgi:signal transduction histidine kinase
MLRRELLILPSTDRYRLTDSNNRLISGTPDWRLPHQLPEGKRANFNLYSNGISYRAFLIRDVAILDSEEEERSSPQRVVLVYGSATTEMDSHLRQVAISTGLGCIAMLAFSLAVTVWIVRAGLRPLDALAAAAANIDVEGWNFEVPASTVEVWELKPLSAALSHSIGRLKIAFERERQMFGDAAHELKTAVAIVKSTIQLALQVRRRPGDYREGLVRALDDTGRLEALVLRMLQLAAIESPLVTNNAQTDVDSALASVIDQFATVAQERGVQIQLNRSEPHCVDVPEQDFVLLATNLIENAIQHSLSGQHIEVTIQKRDGTSELVVKDYGIGIPADALPHIFERFFRSDQSRSRASGGFGLGLAIVRAIVVKYRGTIAVQSVIGRGTTFAVSFPA